MYLFGMKRYVSICVIGMFVLLGVVFGEWEGMNGDVMGVVEGLRAGVKETRYSHRNEVDEIEGRYYVDCSGLVGYVIGEVAPWALEEVWEELDGYGRKRAIGYYISIMEESGGWKKIERIEEVIEGDIIVWREWKYDARGNSGHMLIVLGRAEEEGGGMWKVWVMDASAYKLEEDTREEGRNGIGEGELRLKIDGSGRVVGYQRKKRGKIFEKPIVMGRVVRGNLNYLMEKLDTCPAVD